MLKKDRGSDIDVCFWGTRGTIPAPGPQFAKAGGNTNCTALTCGEHTIIFDAGTGIRELGSMLASENVTRNIHLLLTHAHYDHVEGIPFFAPFSNPEAEVNVYCGALDNTSGVEETICGLMRRPYFPVGPEVLTAKINHFDLGTNEGFMIGNQIKISTCPLNHPGGATGYRVDYHGSSFACITDTEHFEDRDDENILRLIDGVDAFMYDCSLTDEEYPQFVSFGHSTFEVGLRLQKLSKAKQFLAFHHMPFRGDVELDKLEKMIRRENSLNAVAREGVRYCL